MVGGLKPLFEGQPSGKKIQQLEAGVVGVGGRAPGVVGVVGVGGRAPGVVGVGVGAGLDGT